jgi:hypothetical protein
LDRFLEPEKVELLYTFEDYKLERNAVTPDPEKEITAWRALDEPSRLKKLSFGMSSELIEKGRKIRVIVNNG